ncbi:MAG: hypothetical protein Q8922_02855 [Bacteroidota bacterium]|nr:hypothetical protein [Bacteroidota bacterium]MDP4232905.1 hypothetical protein [Bacteroidota bacterium]MDP4241949.1 hypothetical protein [Bacteroidota bacterium]MDP4286852.1 hypothetical protein [Bacteroidota bacterium]
MKRFRVMGSLRRVVSHLIPFALTVIFIPSVSSAQQAHVVATLPEKLERFDRQNDATDGETIDELIQQRIDQEWKSYGPQARPEILKTTADYARLGSESHDLLYEASFHLQPHYYNHLATGPDTSRNVERGQSVMYYVGSARTPLALPVVSNLTTALSGNEASYTINLGILPLPYPGHPDSVRYYVVIERAVESNHSDVPPIRFERFHKDFTAKADETVPLRLAGGTLAKGVYIVQLENGQMLDFYDDFARFIEEHIVISSERLRFALGKQTISDISSRLSIPYSVARTCKVTVQLLSVVDTTNAMTIVDTLRQPADYLAELDMSPFADGPYRYRYTARDINTSAIVYDTIAQFHKLTPLIIAQTNHLAPGDTLKVGGKKVDWAARTSELMQELSRERVVNDRINETLKRDEAEKHDLKVIVDANKKRTIADIHGRVGLGMGASAGDNIFIGIESSKPSLAFDISFGLQYASAPYLQGYQAPSIVSQIGSSPRSLGLQLTWIPVKFFDGLIEPLISAAFYGAWTKDAVAVGGVGTASLISPQLGIACEPLGELNGLGFSVAYGPAYGLGQQGQSPVMDFSAKAYIRF